VGLEFLAAAGRVCCTSNTDKNMCIYMYTEEKRPLKHSSAHPLIVFAPCIFAAVIAMVVVG
jgi:hypothetical protein